jgi:hypothetical protein
MGSAAMSYLWWNQGAEIAALHTDLDAAYAEVEALRARPAVVSLPPAAEPVDENAVVPAIDAPDAASVSSAAVELIPADGAVTPRAAVAADTPTVAPVAAPADAPAATPASPVPTATAASAVLPSQAQ